MEKVRNDLTAAVPKFCLALEEHRRTNDGRVRSSHEFLTHYFPHDGSKSEDRVFTYVPNDVRGPILAAWGIRGMKAALRDSDEKVQSVVHDALVAGDLDHTGFEQGLGADTLVRWVPLADWWSFWRGGKLSKIAIQKALVTAYELALFDAKWFLDTIDSRGGKLKGTDVLSDGLTKDDLTEWIRKVHESGDGSAKGLVTALGWDKIVAKTTNDVLIAVIDAMVLKIGLVKAPEKRDEKRDEKKDEKKDEKPEARGEVASSASTLISNASSTSSAAAPGVKVSEPPPDMDWNEGELKLASKSGAFSAVENMPTVSEKGELQASSAKPPSNDDSPTGEDVILIEEDDPASVSSIAAAAAMPPREEPPTSPRMQAAEAVDSDDAKSFGRGRNDKAATGSVRPTRSR